MLGNLSCTDFSTLHLFIGNFLFRPFWTGWFSSPPPCNCLWAEWCPGLCKPWDWSLGAVLGWFSTLRLIVAVPNLLLWSWHFLFSEIKWEPPKVDKTAMLMWRLLKPSACGVVRIRSLPNTTLIPILRDFYSNVRCLMKWTLLLHERCSAKEDLRLIYF